VEKLGIDFYFAEPYCLWQKAVTKTPTMSSKKILPKEDQHTKDRYRRIDKNLNTDKFKTKKMFKLCNTI